MSTKLAAARVLITLYGLSLAATGLSGCEGGEIFDPNAVPKQLDREVCTDTIDNDGDQLIDCSDPDCAGDPFCTSPLPETPLSPPWITCHEEHGDRSHTPVDLIWTVDSSYSMRDELEWIKGHLNRLADYLIAIQADVHLILLGGPSVCVPQPLGGPDCTDGPRFRHIDTYVGNDDVLDKLISLHPRYRNFLRPGAKVAVVVASDTNPCAEVTQPIPEICQGEGVTAAGFDRDVRLLPGWPDDYVAHSIVAFDDTSNHPRGCSTGQKPGTTYLELSAMTHGMTFPICNANWREVVDDLGMSIAALVDVPCTYARPTVGDPLVSTTAGGEQSDALVGQVAVVDDAGIGVDGVVPPLDINPNLVQVNVEVNGQWRIAPQVTGPSACAGEHGWYLNGDNVQLCPVSCTGLSVRQVRVLFGCNTDID